MAFKTKLKATVKRIWAKRNWNIQVKNAVTEAKQCALAPSYFPEIERKTEQQRIEENVAWARKYGEANKFYNLYGLDRVGSNPEEYMDYWNFMVSRNIVNHMGQMDSQLILLRDKYLFYKYMKAAQLPVPEVFAVFRNGKLYTNNFDDIEIETLRDKKDYFVKSLDGECASYVKHIDNYDMLKSILPEIQKESYIFQERIIQSQAMNVLNPHAVNTYRIVTINKDGNPYVLATELRVGTSKTKFVDNLAAGGLAIGITDSGFLKQYGFYKPAFGVKTDRHPDTGIEFKTFKAPEYDEAVKLALKAHKSFYGIRAIGWDLAVSDKGPVFIEGNDNWEISGVQSCDRPLRKDWEEAIK